MHPNNSTAFHADIQKNTASKPLFHSFHGFHGATRTYATSRNAPSNYSLFFLAHVNKCRVHRGMSGIKGLKAGFEKTTGGTAWNRFSLGASCQQKGLFMANHLRERNELQERINFLDIVLAETKTKPLPDAPYGCQQYNLARLCRFDRRAIDRKCAGCPRTTDRDYLATQGLWIAGVSHEVTR